MKSQISKPSFLLLVSGLLLLTACGGTERGEGAPTWQGTPTVAARFAMAVLPIPHPAPAEGIPTVSLRFVGAQKRIGPSAGGTPTISPHFAGATLKQAPSGPGGTPTPAFYFAQGTPLATNTPRSTGTPWPTPLPEEGEVATSPEFTLTYVYTDELAAGWSVTESWGVRLDLEDTTHAHGGEHAIAITPEEDYGSLFFTVVPGSPRVYPYDRTLGVRFWLNAGDEALYQDQLAVTVLGSNAYTYWEKDDKSVEITKGGSFFSETRLYYLGLNRALPAETWIEIVVWLDDLPFDPDYTYVTGLYVKSEAGLRNTFYVDDVALVVLIVLEEQPG